MLDGTPFEPESVIMGCVLTGGVGQAPARQAVMKAGLPIHVSALTIGKVCGSGLKAVMLADQAIRAQDVSVVVAGGMESMSQSPYFVAKARQGLRMGNVEFKDMLIHDGLWDPYSQCHMGTIGEACASKMNITREEQDNYAKLSYERAIESVTSGRFKNEIVPVTLTNKKETKIISSDEEPSKGDVAKLSTLRPAFDPKGTITAGNASSINDGAAAVLLTSATKARELNVKPIAKIIATAEASLSPADFPVAPTSAIEKLLKKANLQVSDIDLWELNEAFAVVALANNKLLGLETDKVNVKGGSVALGHPIGASGARVLVTLVHALKERGGRYGVASLCIGGGEGVAVLIEAL